MFQNVYQILDPYLIFAYRLFDVPIFGYLFGTLVLALGCVLLSQATVYFCMWANRELMKQQNREMVRMQNLSVFALLSKDKSAYKACNKEANDAFGKYFFAQIAIGAASLWPVPFALGWMQGRFGHIDFPLLGFDASVGYTFAFFPLLVLAYILVGKLKPHLPGYHRLEAIAASARDDSQELVTLADISARQPANAA